MSLSFGHLFCLNWWSHARYYLAWSRLEISGSQKSDSLRCIETLMHAFIFSPSENSGMTAASIFAGKWLSIEKQLLCLASCSIVMWFFFKSTTRTLGARFDLDLEGLVWDKDASSCAASLLASAFFAAASSLCLAYEVTRKFLNFGVQILKSTAIYTKRHCTRLWSILKLHLHN